MSEAPFEAAASQAMQTAVMSIEFLITVARAVQERHDSEAVGRDAHRAAQVAQLRQLIGPVTDASAYYAHIVSEQVTNPAIRDALLTSEQWPRIAADLHQLEQAGVDVRDLLGDASRTADRIAATLMSPTPPSPAEHYAHMVRQNMPNEQLRNALLESEQWPRIAEQMRRMEAAGVNMPALLAQANGAGATLNSVLQTAWDQAAQRASALAAEAAPEAQATKTDNVWAVNLPARGNRSESALDNRGGDLKAAGISTQENGRFVRLLRDTLQDEHKAAVIVVSRQWPQIAAQMRDLENRGIHPGNRLIRLPQELARRATSGQRVNVAAAVMDLLNRPSATSAPAAKNPPSAPATAVTTTETTPAVTNTAAAATSTATTSQKATPDASGQAKDVRAEAREILSRPRTKAEPAAAQMRAAAANSHSTTSGPPTADPARPKPTAATSTPASPPGARAMHGHKY